MQKSELLALKKTNPKEYKKIVKRLNSQNDKLV